MKDFFLTFGSGDSRLFAGLTPTFALFILKDGTGVTAPGITQIGSSTGFYYFSYEPSPTLPIVFLVDGGSSITSSSDRYVRGSLDPIATVDQRLGFAEDSYGSTLGASTVFGMAKRINELWQADATFSKTTGAWSQYAKGTSTLLFEKTLTNTTAQVTKV